MQLKRTALDTAGNRSANSGPCSGDYVRAYNQANAACLLVAEVCGRNPPALPRSLHFVTVRGMLVRFTSDADGLTGCGYTLQWSCLSAARVVLLESGLPD